MIPIPPTICRWCGYSKDDCRCCRCHVSQAAACLRIATTVNLLGNQVCKVCHAGCGELRFGLPSDIWVWCRVVSAHEPLRMEYVP